MSPEDIVWDNLLVILQQLTTFRDIEVIDQAIAKLKEFADEVEFEDRSYKKIRRVLSLILQNLEPGTQTNLKALHPLKLGELEASLRSASQRINKPFTELFFLRLSLVGTLVTLNSLADGAGINNIALTLNELRIDTQNKYWNHPTVAEHVKSIHQAIDNLIETVKDNDALVKLLKDLKDSCSLSEA